MQLAATAPDDEEDDRKVRREPTPEQIVNFDRDFEELKELIAEDLELIGAIQTRPPADLIEF